ncbi:hypothetical protein AWENTII_009151 [Aspergillus wentii]|nr:hypothetical protein MW887_000893 [Aspergillus wentii]
MPLRNRYTADNIPSYIKELETKPEFKILKPLVQQDTSYSPSEAVQKIVEITKTLRDSPLGNHCWDTCCALLELAAQTAPGQHNRLVEFVVHLKNATVNDENGQPLMVEDGIVWTGLPTFGYGFTDEMFFDHKDNENTPEEIERWLNKAAFMAVLSDACGQPNTPEWMEIIDASPYAQMEFSDAFPQSRKGPETAVQSACLWFIYGGEKLWKNVHTGWRGFNHEGWVFWKERLTAAEGDYNDETNKLIRDALESIRKAEH